MRRSAIRSSMSFLVVVLMGAAVLIALAPIASAATFTVNSTADDTDGGGCEPSPGDCTLREAINAANNTTAKDTISFALGSGVPAIAVGVPTSTPLPDITKPVVIDGSSGGATRVELDGTSAGVGARGLVVGNRGSTISDLVINHFNQEGIMLYGNGSNRVTGCRLGTNPAGTSAEPNGFGISMLNFGGTTYSAGANIIGGTTASERNLISGNTFDGIVIYNSNGNIIEGNRIGTNAAGTTSLQNGRDGIVLSTGLSNIIGGTALGTRNLISGNGANGVDITDGYTGINTSGNVVQGNLIGTNASGAGAVPNGEDGVHFEGHPVNNLVGGTTPAARNVITGNTGDGVGLDLDGQLDQAAVIAGNYIGVDADGIGALGNSNGIHIDGGPKMVIGGTARGAGNVIAGNFGAGIVIEDTAHSPGQARGTVIQANFIGTNAAGTDPIEETRGISVVGQPDTRIGGTSRSARNVISGNTVGIEVHDAAGTIIQGNFVGTNRAGTAGIPNLAEGVALLDSRRSLVGGNPAGAGNRIAFNGGAIMGGQGIMIDGGTGNSVQGNSIFSNKSLGIDLDADGVTPNDTHDVDTGTNELQNFPVVASAKSNGSITHVKGAIPSTKSTKVSLEFFSSGSCDASNHGEGKRFLGRTAVTTANSGTGSFNVVFSMGTKLGNRVTATATSPGGSTSEFSACRRVVSGR